MSEITERFLKSVMRMCWNGNLVLKGKYNPII
jgi:hypothetical protein